MKHTQRRGSFESNRTRQTTDFGTSCSGNSDCCFLWIGVSGWSRWPSCQHEPGWRTLTTKLMKSMMNLSLMRNSRRITTSRRTPVEKGVTVQIAAALHWVFVSSRASHWISANIGFWTLQTQKVDTCSTAVVDNFLVPCIYTFFGNELLRNVSDGSFREKRLLFEVL
jgi:hypothetical protein